MSRSTRSEGRFKRFFMDVDHRHDHRLKVRWGLLLGCLWLALLVVVGSLAMLVTEPAAFFMVWGCIFTAAALMALVSRLYDL